MHLFLQLLLGAIATSIVLLILTTKKHKRHPPGPPRFPIIGNLHRLNASPCPHLSFYELSKTYGPLMSLKLGFVPAIVVSSARMVKEVLKTHDHIFCSRPKLKTQQKVTYNGLAMTFAPYDDYWKAMRKLGVVHLFSSKKVQSLSWIREEEVHRMTQKISNLSTGSGTVNLSELMMCFTYSVICRAAFGRQPEDGRGFQDILRETQGICVSFCFSDYFPFTGWLDRLTGMSAELDRVFMKLDGLLEEIIEEHGKAVKPESDQEYIIDVLLGLQEVDSFGVKITQDHIKGILMEVFVAGTDTSAATVVLGMTELMRNPEAMKRVQEEVRSSIGNKAKDMIKEEDLEGLVYLKAVVKETMRLHPVAPLLVPRIATQKCTIEGYEIGENTLVYVNAWAIGRDPESWEAPEEFKPERFMCDDPKDFRGQDFELIPFGSGRRICPGMNMGLAMVELALANLVYLFDWSVPLGVEEDVLDTSVLPGVTTHKKIPLCLVAKSVA